jgi:RimJ/RimL family protein N-acetyltransferase
LLRMASEDCDKLNFRNGLNVSLVPMSKDYSQQIVRWTNDPEIRAITGSHFPRTMESVKKQLEDADSGSQKADNVWFGIMYCAENVLIGEASISRINWPNRNVNVSVTIGEKAYWNRGFGTEAARLLMGYAFEELQMHKVKASFLAENAIAQKIAEVLGMHYEFTFHEQVYSGFAWHDQPVYAIFEREWFATAPAPAPEGSDDEGDSQ